MLEEMEHLYFVETDQLVESFWNDFEKTFHWRFFCFHMICKFLLFEGKLSWTQNENQENT